MELWLTFVALLAWQGLARVPRGGAAFFRFFGRTWIWREYGLTWLPPWGIEPAFVLPGVELCVSATEVSAFDAARDVACRLPLESGLELSTQSNRILVGGTRWLRAASPEHAVQLAERIHRLAECEPEGRLSLAAEQEQAAFDAKAAAGTAKQLHGALWLVGCIVTAEVLVLSAVPLFLSGLGSEGGLRMVLPGLGVLHALAWFAMLFAELRLRLPGKGERLAVAALYPPALLYAPSALSARALVGCHPLAVAPAISRERDWIPSLQRDLAEARRDQTVRRHDSLRALADAAGVDTKLLDAEPERVSPIEARWCPVCRDAFRAGFGNCPDCRVPTQPFASS